MGISLCHNKINSKKYTDKYAIIKNNKSAIQLYSYTAVERDNVCHSELAIVLDTMLIGTKFQVTNELESNLHWLF